MFLIGKMFAAIGSMIYKLKLLPKALKDLKETKKQYNVKKDFLGDEFKFEANKEIDYILSNPFNYQIRFLEFRKALINRFPYCIYYLINETLNQIIVFAVLHNKRSIDVLKKRLK